MGRARSGANAAGRQRGNGSGSRVVDWARPDVGAGAGTSASTAAASRRRRRQGGDRGVDAEASGDLVVEKGWIGAACTSRAKGINLTVKNENR